MIALIFDAFSFGENSWRGGVNVDEVDNDKGKDVRDEGTEGAVADMNDDGNVDGGMDAEIATAAGVRLTNPGDQGLHAKKKQVAPTRVQV